MTSTRARSALIREETSPYRRPKENNPGPGAHDKHLTRFGADVHHKMDFGNKYVFKPVAGPPPGAYNIESGHNMSKMSVRSAHINGETSPYRRPKEKIQDQVIMMDIFQPSELMFTTKWTWVPNTNSNQIRTHQSVHMTHNQELG